MTKVKPYKESTASKKEQVAEMFNNIAYRYDFLNHFLSFGIDQYWRNRAIKQLENHNTSRVLDIATGTGDFALHAFRKLKIDSLIGIDISEGMLEIGRQKIQKQELSAKIEMQVGDSEQIDFPANEFDAITVAFGVRNFANLDKGLGEMFRVLKKGGKLVILEFSNPRAFPVKQLYGLYSNYVLPGIGSMFSKDKSAYRYLPESVRAFPDGQRFLDKLIAAGFDNVEHLPLTFGIVSIYTATK